MLSLYMSITGGVSWEQLLVPLSAVSDFWVFIFLFYVSFTYFADTGLAAARGMEDVFFLWLVGLSMFVVGKFQVSQVILFVRLLAVRESTGELLRCLVQLQVGWFLLLSWLVS